MADERLRLVAEVQDQFTGPLDKLNAKLQRVAAGGQQAAKDMKKDFEGFHGTLSKTVSVMDGMIAPLRSMGSVSLGAGLGLAGIVTAVAGFAKSTQQLKIMSSETGLAVNELRAFGNLGARFGVSADTMQAGVKRFSDEMSQLRRRFGEAYTGLEAMKLGDLVEKLVAAPNMKAALDAAMDALSNIGDPVKRRKVAEMLFGSDQIGAVAGQVTGRYREMMDEILRMQGTLDEKTSKAADEFQKNLSRMGEAAERLKLNTIGPVLKGLNEIVIAGDRAGIRGNAEAMEGTTQERLAKAQAKRDFLTSDAGGGAEKNADRLKSLEREITRLTDELKRMKENPAGPSGVSAIPMSFSGGGGLGAMIQRASFGGSGGYGGGSAPGLGGFGSPLPTLGGGYGGTGGRAGAGGVPSGRSGGSPATGAQPDVAPTFGGYTGNDGRRASRSGMSASGRENVASWMDFLQRPVAEGGLGMPRGRAQATIAMMQGESGLNLSPGIIGDSGHAHGTAQWSDQRGNPRFPLLRRFAESKGKPWQDRSVQQQYLRMEMLGLPGAVSHRGAYDAMMGAATDEDALFAGIKRFENPQQHALAYAIRKPFLDRLRRDGSNAPSVASPSAPVGTRPGDNMMRRLYGDQAPVARGPAKGSLDITLHGFPAGTKPRASMDDLFRDVTVSKSRQMDTTSI